MRVSEEAEKPKEQILQVKQLIKHKRTVQVKEDDLEEEKEEIKACINAESLHY